MKIVLASTLGAVAVSKRDVLTPPIVPFLGDVDADDGGDLEPELLLLVAVSVEYGDVGAFFSGIEPRPDAPVTVEDAVDVSLFCVCA